MLVLLHLGGVREDLLTASVLILLLGKGSKCWVRRETPSLSPQELQVPSLSAEASL